MSLIVVTLPDSFWNNTENCLILHRSHFKSKKNISLLHSGYEIVNSSICNKATPKDSSITSVLGSRNVIIRDCRLVDTIVNSNSHLLTLQKNEIISFEQSFSDYTQMAYRILLNPSKQLQSVILQNKKLLFTRKYVIGVQIRTGGCLADYQEKTEMMTLSQLQSFPNTIVVSIVKWNYNPSNTVIYLSTDSSYAEKYIRDKLGSDYMIVVSKGFKRSHSGGKSNDESVQSALVDLYLLADTDALIICKGSGFGRVALAITRARHSLVYEVTHSLAKNYNATTCKCG